MQTEKLKDDKIRRALCCPKPLQVGVAVRKDGLGKFLNRNEVSGEGDMMLKPIEYH
jgi:hypothetical protein